MSLTKPKLSWKRLVKHLDQLEKRFVAGNLNLLRVTARAKLELDAYVVLSHAEFEQFYEDLAKWRLHRIVEQWIHKGKASGATMALVLAYNADIDRAGEQANFDRVRLRLQVAKREHSRLIHDNHGTGIDYLWRLFCPLGVDIPSDVALRASLEGFVKLRGERAHKNRLGATIQKSPADLRVIVGDCLKMAQRILENCRHL